MNDLAIALTVVLSIFLAHSVLFAARLGKTENEYKRYGSLFSFMWAVLFWLTWKTLNQRLQSKNAE